MKYRIRLIFFFFIWLTQGFSQKTDSLYQYEAVDEYNLNGFKEIVHTINDSVYKTIKYRKRKIISIKYTGRINECFTPIKQDTLYTQNGDEIRTIIKNEVVQLSKSSNCDSLLLVQKIKRYKTGQLIEEFNLKRVGRFSDHPCGKWNTFYMNNELKESKEFDSCYDNKLNNLILVDTVWSPDKQFVLELYKEQLFFAMPGQGSDHMATIILKDKNGRVLNYISSNSNSDERVMYTSIEIEWDMNEKRVWYAKAKSFDLEKKVNNKLNGK